jgi:hypothetical protein
MDVFDRPDVQAVAGLRHDRAERVRDRAAPKSSPPSM